MPMKNHPHPGRIVRQECIEPLGLTITEAAAGLGVTRQALNNIVNEKAGISPEMAIRLSQAFGGSAEMWVRLQGNYDLSRAMQQNIRVSSLRESVREQPALPAAYTRAAAAKKARPKVMTAH